MKLDDFIVNKILKKIVFILMNKYQFSYRYLNICIIDSNLLFTFISVLISKLAFGKYFL